MTFQLPAGWRLGRVTQGRTTVYYKDTWHTRVAVTSLSQQTVDNLVENPNPRQAVCLYNDNCLPAHCLTDEKFLRALVKEKCISVEYALKQCPSIKRWLRSVGLVESKIRPTVYATFMAWGEEYQLTAEGWCVQKDNSVHILPKKRFFKSIQYARSAVKRGEITLSDVADYSLGALLECLGDAVYARYLNYFDNSGIERDAELFQQDNSTKAWVDTYEKQLLQTIINCPKEIIDIQKVRHTKLWSPIWKYDNVGHTEKRDEFIKLWFAVLRQEISGFEARLIYTNGSWRALNRERIRFKQQDFHPYHRFLAEKRYAVQSMSFDKACAYIREGIIGLIEDGFRDQNATKTTFIWHGNVFIMNCGSGESCVFNSSLMFQFRKTVKEAIKANMSPVLSYLQQSDNIEIQQAVEHDLVEYERCVTIMLRAFYKDFGRLKSSGIPSTIAWNAALKNWTKRSRKFQYCVNRTAILLCKNRNLTVSSVKINSKCEDYERRIAA